MFTFSFRLKYFLPVSRVCYSVLLQPCVEKFVINTFSFQGVVFSIAFMIRHFANGILSLFCILQAVHSSCWHMACKAEHLLECVCVCVFIKVYGWNGQLIENEFHLPTCKALGWSKDHNSFCLQLTASWSCHWNKIIFLSCIFPFSTGVPWTRWSMGNSAIERHRKAVWSNII